VKITFPTPKEEFRSPVIGDIWLCADRDKDNNKTIVAVIMGNKDALILSANLITAVSREYVRNNLGLIRKLGRGEQVSLEMEAQ
jgi:hypothetical protein